MARQNLLFSYFACTLTAEIRAAKAEGRYFEGVSDLSGSNITEILQPKANTFYPVSAFLCLLFTLLRSYTAHGPSTCLPPGENVTASLNLCILPPRVPIDAAHNATSPLASV